MKRKRVENDSNHQKRRKYDVIHPELGTKKYKSIQLKNGLTVILISDPITLNGGMAAASMSVRVGSMYDPPEVHGLSHFLEHMVFMGSKKFPGENEFMKFLNKHGGQSNGATDLEHTIFHMTVDPDYLKQALAMFSQFFIAPRLETSSMEREISAIEQEFESHRQDDNHRLEQLKGHTSPLGHPYNRFQCGNKLTLLNENLSLESLRQHLQNFFNDHYFGDSMKLVLIGKETLDVLETWVREFFNGLNSGSRRTRKFNSIGHIWNPDILYGLQAIGENHRFEISWMIPPKCDKFCVEKPENYLIQLLGDECKGSLCAFFKENGWVTSLDVKVGGTGYSSTSIGRLFVISINLTNCGLEKKYQIVSFIYHYLQLLRDMDPLQWIMEEYNQMKKIEFESLDFSGWFTIPLECANYLSGNMLDYPVTHVIAGDYLHQTWNPEAIKDLLKHFNPRNMRLDLVSKSIKATVLKREPWFNSRYIEEQIPLVFKEEWNQTFAVDESLFHLPAPNKFIPSSFKPRDHSGDDLSTQILVNEPCMKIWYKCDVGLSYAHFIIYLHDKNENVKNQLMVKMFLKLLEDALSEIIFQGNSAGLQTSLSLCDTKVQLTINGYYEKLGLFISEIFTKFMSFIPTVKCFEVIKESMNRDLKNYDLFDHSEQLLLQIVSQSKHSNRSKLQVLKSISFGDLLSFTNDLRSQIFIKGICYGDILECEARSICNFFQSLQISPLHGNLRDRVRIVHLPRTKSRVDVKVKNKLDCNSLAKVYFRIGCKKRQESRNIAMLNLFVSIIREELFHELRTKETLGYIVDCETHLMHGVGLDVCVLSSDYNPYHLSRRIYNFMNLFGMCLEELPDNTFEDYKKGVNLTLPQGSGKSIWEHIDRERCIDNLYSEEKKELKLIKKKDLIEWYKRYFRISSPFCRTVVVRIWGCNTHDDMSLLKARLLRRKKKIHKRWFITKMLRKRSRVLSKPK
ncbi:Metalloenzyme LuxS/M16 peptidase-like [Arabidopsis suecica]|uniref:Metalloenzyme LuxS/M16 peptidase-like n=1 Tax=Arabidopsis suecica TaxID=45249 RepID=A0A8T1Z591_ARASU|nr:Metalloenzyme LuxS/M16 peptidase-like [Arabidopsis suecica]